MIYEFRYRTHCLRKKRYTNKILKCLEFEITKNVSHLIGQKNFGLKEVKKHSGGIFIFLFKKK